MYICIFYHNNLKKNTKETYLYTFFSLLKNKAKWYENQKASFSFKKHNKTKSQINKLTATAKQAQFKGLGDQNTRSVLWSSEVLRKQLWPSVAPTVLKIPLEYL